MEGESIAEAPGKPWFVYLVRAANGSLYCGISDDPQRRFLKHCSGQGARYFKTSPAQALVYVEQWPDRRQALQQERLVKKLRKCAKEALVASYVSEQVVAELSPCDV